MTTPNDAELPKCGKCLQPIHPSEIGLRHYGFSTAHAENRCLEILAGLLSSQQAEVDYLTSKLAAIDESFQYLRGERDGLHSTVVKLAENLSNADIQISQLQSRIAELERQVEGLEHWTREPPEPPQHPTSERAKCVCNFAKFPTIPPICRQDFKAHPGGFLDSCGNVVDRYYCAHSRACHEVQSNG